MKKLLLSALTAVLFLIPTGLTAENTEENFIVTVKDGAAVTENYEEKYNLIQLTAMDHGLYVTDEENAKKIENHSAIESVEESGICRLAADFNDPYYSNYQKWVFNAIKAYPVSANLSSYYRPTIVVIDTGFYFGHRDKGNVYAGKDYITGGTTTKDHFTHGTACAGVISAKINNNIGIAGLANQCNVIILSIFEPDSKGDPVAYDKNIIAAIYDAVDVYDADVISMSFGGSSLVTEAENAVHYAIGKGAILVAATGNQGTGRDTNGNMIEAALEYPAAYEGVIGVANVNSSLRVADSSSSNESVYISAPGSSILTLGTDNNDNYKYFSGTSLATPMVAALAGLAKCIDPDITQDEFKYYLRLTSTDIETAGYDIASGYGIVNFDLLLNTLKTDLNYALAGDGTTSSPYLIFNEKDLRLFALKVSGGEAYASAKLMTNINVSDDFIGIDTEYRGVFNGNSYRISNLNDTLFHHIGPGGKITYLKVSGTINDEKCDALIANENNGTITHCTTEGNVDRSFAAGVCGTNYGTITASTNRAEINGTVAAGIAAECYGGTISQCSNFGTIVSDDYQAGGICGYLSGGAMIKNCYNVSSVRGTTRTGGIVNAIYSGSVNNCYFADASGTFESNNANITRKSPDYMKTKGFVCMLNGGQAYFTTDDDNLNYGYPILGSTTLTSFFYDAPTYEWYADAVYELAADNILEGRQKGYFYPSDNVTRAEFMTILAKVQGVDLTNYYGSEPFYDVSPSDWFYAAVTWAYSEGLAYGKSNTYFDPNAKVTREEISCFIMRYLRSYSSQSLPEGDGLRFTDHYQISSWAREDVEALAALGIIKGFPDGSFMPQTSALRSQAALMTYNMRNEL